MDLAQQKIGSATLYSQWNIVFNKRYDPTPGGGGGGEGQAAMLKAEKALGKTLSNWVCAGWAWVFILEGHFRKGIRVTQIFFSNHLFTND